MKSISKHWALPYKKVWLPVISGCLALISYTSCEDFVEIDPPRTDLVKSTVFADDATAEAAILDIYYSMYNNGFASGDARSFSFLSTLSSDEQIDYTANPNFSVMTQEFYKTSLSPSNNDTNGFWNALYNWIYKSNSIIEGLSQSADISDNLRKQLQGEAKFIRAFCHFYLVNLYGNIPLIVTTNYQKNAELDRSDKVLIYDQIISDLRDSQALLANDYSFSDTERTRPNKWVATAFLARVYLYSNDWNNAEVEASKIINNSSQYKLAPNLNNSFSASNSEAIWQFGNFNENYPSDWSTFRFTSFSGPRNGALRSDFVSDFELGDKRRSNWISTVVYSGNTFYCAVKYKRTGNQDYTTLLRLAEQYLIRAEARVQQEKLTEARQDLDSIRYRAALPLYADSTHLSQLELLDVIMRERNHELFTEWGHRWLDLKRWGKADEILRPLKGISWQSTDVLYPIPEYQILNSPITQNPGY